MSFSIAATFLLVTLSALAVQGQNSIQCYYCQITYIPGNTGALSIYYGIDNGCGHPMNTSSNALLTVFCSGTCVTQLTYDGNGRNSFYRMCSLVKPVIGCVASTGVPRAVTCTSTCSTNLCNNGTVPYAAQGVTDSAVSSLVSTHSSASFFSLLLSALAYNYRLQQ